MITKHTPGPWTYTPAKKLVDVKGSPDTFDLPAEVTNSDNTAKIKVGGITAEGDANARLIAAAPELLEQLHTLASAAARIVEDDSKPTLVHMRELDRQRAAASALIDRINS